MSGLGMSTPKTRQSMLVGHERREGRREERETFGAHGNADRYQMREKLLSIGDAFWIKDESGRRAFKVNGKALRCATPRSWPMR